MLLLLLLINSYKKQANQILSCTPFCSTAGQACAAYVNAQLLSKAKKIVLLEIVTQPDEER